MIFTEFRCRLNIALAKRGCDEAPMWLAHNKWWNEISPDKAAADIAAIYGSAEALFPRSQ